MNINNTFQNVNHPKSILTQLKYASDLPFKKILSSDEIAKSIVIVRLLAAGRLKRKVVASFSCA